MHRPVLAAVLVLLLSSCGGDGDGAVRAPEISIGVDPRVELLGVIQLLAGAPGVRDPGTDYGRDVMAYFSGWSGHESVGVMRELTGLGFGYDAPVTAVLHLSDLPGLQQVSPWDDDLVQRAGGLTNLGRFTAALRAFAEDTGFEAFFEDHADYYDRVADVYAGVIGDSDAGMLESYFGLTRGSYSILPAPLSFYGYGSRIAREDGTLDVYCTIMGSAGLEPGEVDHDTALFLRSFVWHEFAHSFVNPLCEEYADRIDETMCLFIPIRRVMENQAYASWQICVREHLVRAAVIRLIEAEYGEQAAREELLCQERNGFVYIEPLMAVYAEMEDAEGRGSDFESMFPRFLDAFDSILEEGPENYTPLMGMTINMVLSLGLPIVYVTPTAEADPDVQSEITRYVGEVAGMFNPSAEVLPDTIALARDLSGKTVIAYGTPRGNLYMRAVSDAFPFTVTIYGAIETDTVLAGTRMRLISTLPNPRVGDGWLLVYTACRAEDVPGINHVMHGSTEYVVLDGADILQSGFYRHGREGWTF
jgi:hypothetical protein